MSGSVRCLAIALIGAAVISAIWAAPASKENEINYNFIRNGDDLVQDRVAHNSVADYNSEEIEEPESSNPEPYPTHTTTTSAPQQSSTTENQFDSSAEESNSSTTEHPHNVIGRIYSPQRDKPGRIAFAGGVHQYRVGPGEDPNKRALEEYYYHFVRVEQGLPPTTKRGDRFGAP